ncbi:MAG TPA: Urease accessory protein UreE [Acetobacteraceae bacterium]|nr:Urease accessory protein UreE [Acetobacteraceae bacterium]
MRAHQVVPAGSWVAEEERDQVVLAFDHRHRRRIVLQTDSGQELLLDLPEAVRMRDGEGLLLEGGGVVRIAWHLGNRHLPVQLVPGAILIRADHVIGSMVRQLGGTVRETEAAFDPEPGAYAGGHAHEHDHDEQ